ncbi:MAG: metal-dependent hydrolase [Myxococcota bacterium]|nr:metal-dependent hydrolase [Myxococcota bacterium]
MTAAAQTGSSHPTSIPVRRVRLPFDESIPRDWLAGNLLETHVFNGLNLVFPDGERFFIRSVHDHLEYVTDPELRAQVRAFAGQEANHAHEHERYFEILRAQGYRFETFLRRFRRFLRIVDRILPKSLRIAITAGAEHWTATLGALALDDPFMDDAHPTMRKLILWHAAEEVEHKAVAYDVMQAAGIGWFTRVLGYGLATISLFAWSGFATRMLLRQDGVDREKLAALRRHAHEHGRTGQPPPRIGRAIRAYLKPGFHPDQVDDGPAARRRIAEMGLAVQGG